LRDLPDRSAVAKFVFEGADDFAGRKTGSPTR
jgi:hypothetical protein